MLGEAGELVSCNVRLRSFMPETDLIKTLTRVSPSSVQNEFALF